MYANGGTIINYDGSGRLSTTSAGASITGSLNITSAITHNTHGTILDSSANLTNINNVYASGYRIGSTQIVDSSRNLTNIVAISNSGTITSTGSDHTFYSGGSTQSLAVGRLANQSIKIEVTDNNNIIQAFQDSDSNGNHYFDLRRDFDGTGANMFRVRKGTLTQFEIDGDSNATFTGNVGINETSIDANLHITDSNPNIKFEINGQGKWAIGMPASQTYLAFDESNDALTTPTMVMTKTTKRVGIGTTSPDVKLRVDHDDNTVAFKVTGGGGGANIAEFVRDVGTSGVSVSVNGSSARPQIKFVKPSNTFAIGVNSSSFEIADNDVLGTNTRLSIDSSGLVGIGTTSPVRNLHLHESSSSLNYMKFSNTTTGTTGTDGFEIGINSDEHAVIYQRENLDIKFRTNNTDRVIFKNDGNVGIGTTTPSAGLHLFDRTLRIQKSAGDRKLEFIDNRTGANHFSIEHDANQIYFYNVTTTEIPLQIRNNGNVLMSAGNVGIGTTSPSEKLHVIGNILTSGGVKVGDSSADALHFVGILKQGTGSGTTVMDSSRNLTNIGTISSGAITTSGAITAGAAAIGNTGEGYAIGHQYKKEYWYDEIVGDSDGSDNKWTLKNSTGSDLATTTLNHVYRVRLVTLGTGTNTGQVYLADNVDGNGWRVKAVSINTSPTESSNYPKLEIDNNVPKVSIEHTSNYTIRIFVEEYNTGNSGGMYTIFGTDALLTYRDNSTRLGINRETPGQTLDVNGTIGINGTEIITSARNLHNIGSISSGAITSGAITSSGSITSGGTLTGASSELLRRTVSGWTVPTQTVLGSYYGSNLNDYIYLKVPGNSTNAHGIALVTDNAFYYGRTSIETGQITNDATSPLDESTGFKVTYDGNATFAGDVLISEPNPTLILQDTSDDDDHGIRFRDNGGTDRYSITTLNDNFNFITEGSRELIFKPAGTEKFRVGAAYNESKQDLRFPDNAILRLGTGTDLNIYHNGSDSLINNDTGHLYIQNYSDDGDIRFYSDNGSGGTAEYIRCDGGLGQVKLFHYGSEKFITTSAGIKVTGEVNVTGELEINGTDVIDSSRNLTNIGTISSTNITSNGSAVVVQSKPLTVVGQPINISAPNSAEMKFLQTTSSTSASKGSIQWFDSNSNSCGTINLKADGAEDNSGVMEFYVTAQTDELGDDPFGINKMMTITENGVTVHGSLSKSSGSFRIDHPLKPETHDLVHSFVESPQADNLYRGMIDLHNGRATIDLDEWFGMTSGTFLALNRDIQAYVNNADTWDNVRAKVMGSQLVIECQNPESNAEVSWLVIGERQDKEIHESSLTDNHGKVIVEPLKLG
jgi:hypothetical protein